MHWESPRKDVRGARHRPRLGTVHGTYPSQRQSQHGTSHPVVMGITDLVGRVLKSCPRDVRYKNQEQIFWVLPPKTDQNDI